MEDTKYFQHTFVSTKFNLCLGATLYAVTGSEYLVALFDTPLELLIIPVLELIVSETREDLNCLIEYLLDAAFEDLL